MRFHSTHARLYACVLGLSAAMSASTRSLAQDVVSPAVPIDQEKHHHLHQLWDHFHRRQPTFPRTYSYYYDRWFNQPQHFRVVGPDGQTYWRRTVRGLPMGTPWPQYGPIETP